MAKRVLKIILALFCLFFLSCGGGGPTSPADDNPPVWDKPSTGISGLKPGFECLTVSYGTAHDPEGDYPLYFRIYFIDKTATNWDDPFLGPGHTVATDPAGASRYVIPHLIAGHEYYCGVRAVDSGGNEDPNTGKLHAVPVAGGADPVAKAKVEPNPARVGQAVRFSDNGSYDPDGGAITGYEWDWNNDGMWDSQGIEAEHTWNDAGAHQVGYRVTDDEGVQMELSPPLEIRISSDPVAKAEAEPSPGWTGEPVHFSGDKSYDPDGGAIAKYEWDWNNDGVWDAEGAEVDHAWDTRGTYPVGFRVTDDEGFTDTLDNPLAVRVKTSGGDLLWARGAGGEGGFATGYAIAGLSDGSTVVSGYFDGEVTFGLGEPNETVLDSDNNQNILVARYSPDGTLAWARKVAGIYHGRGYAISALSDDSLVVGGSFVGSATFGQGEPNETVLITDNGYLNVFIARFRPDGNVLWAKGVAGLGDGFANAVALLSDDSTVVSGSFSGSATFGKGEPNETILSSDYDNVFIARYRSDGNLEWARKVAGSDYEYGSAVAALSDDSTVVSGCFAGSAIFGQGEPNETILASEYSLNIFIARYMPDGSLAWAKNAGGASDDCANAVTRLSDDSTVVSGYFGGWSGDPATFGQGESNETILDSVGAADIFVARYRADGTLAWAKSAGGADADEGNSITGLSDDSVVVTGFFGYSDGSQATFGHGEPDETILHSAGGYYDIFTARFNPDGTLAWAQSAGGGNDDIGYAIAALHDDSTVVTGYYSYLATFGEGQTGETILTGAGYQDLFVARYSR